MKGPCLSFALIGCAALYGVTCHAASSGPAAQQTSSTSAAKPSSVAANKSQHVAVSVGGESQRDTRPSEKRQSLQVPVPNHSFSHGDTTGTSRPKHVPNERERPTSHRVVNHQMDVIRPAHLEKDGVPQIGTVNKALRIRQSNSVRPITQSFASVRHRGANPPTIGGANSLRTNSARISGTGMHRKP